MDTKTFLDLVLATLDDIKALDILAMDVSSLTSIADHMVICSGRSQRHVMSIADKLITTAKANHHPPLGVEGGDIGEWVLVDLNDIIVHIMCPETRQYYQLEKLWSVEMTDDLRSQ